MSRVIQKRLLSWAAIFLFFYSIILTLSPAVRERTWDVDYRLSHWSGFCVWVVLMILAHHVTVKHLPEHDPYLLPAASLLSGWGLLTIWRLDETFGIRQMIWLGISILVFGTVIYIPQTLVFFRRHKYVLLSGGLFLTALTLLFGTNPLGFGPRLWLGCCGVYFQPSEPLKLLLVIYLAAYLADHHPIRLTTFPLLVPTIILTGIALLLLIVQRDLGTASIFIFIYTIILFLVTGKKRVLFGAVILLTAALLIGYFFIDIIHVRVQAWLDPWYDPTGQSYQIVQSLLAVANGGTMGRGPGIGSPLLVPVAISDFIFAAIAEETGLVGTLGLLVIFWVILVRGMISSLRATDRFRRFLAAGIVTYIGVQSLLIIGGNLRLVPLTGVTLPFVSYGGSSLLTSFIAVAILLIISTPGDNEPVTLSDPQPYVLLTGLLGLGLAACALTLAWWTIVRAPDLLNRTDNARRAIADRYVPRGNILDRNNLPIDITEGESGSYIRAYLYPDLAPVTGYTHPVFGQAGIEASLDPYLRGLQGNPASSIWWDHLIFGTPPPGLDVRLSIDLNVQTKADQYLDGHTGALILMNAETGEIIAMSSRPTFNPTNLDLHGIELLQDPTAPLVNRSTQGLYPVGTALLPFSRAQFGERDPTHEELQTLYEKLGFYKAPIINLPVAYETTSPSVQDLRISPLQMILAAASLSGKGLIPEARIAMAINTKEQGWVVLPTQNEPVQVFDSKASGDAALSFIVGGKPYWRYIGQAKEDETTVTWLIGGTLPDWGGTPLVLVVSLEENNITLARHIQEQLLNDLVK